MSRCVVQEVLCPACGGAQEEKVFVSVNGTRIKTAADLLIDGSWDVITCLKCGLHYSLDTPLLFSDLPGGAWIFQHDRSERHRFASLEEEAGAIFRREFIDQPPAAIRAQALAVKQRICFGRAQLVEKLLARREGIDDVALECLKLVLLRDYITELYPHGPTEFYLRQADAEQLHLSAVPIGELRPVLDVTVSRLKLQKIAEDAESFRAPYPELFSKLYVNASRYWTDEAEALPA